MTKISLLTLFCVFFAAACTSTPPVKKQAYAFLPDQRVFEYEFPVVWKGIETALQDYKIIERDSEEGRLETDWIYSQSREKYQEYQVNKLPRKKYLQIRYKQKISARKVMGGTEVQVETTEETERLKTDGSSAGYGPSEQADPSLSSGLLEKIGLSILALPPQ